MSDCPCVDPCRCPLCGQSNRCAMVQAKPDGTQAPCWCMREQFRAELLQRVAPEAQRKACICQACVKASQVLA